ncbi:hypothetical protein ES703_02148 [subsurface metagenome]
MVRSALTRSTKYDKKIDGDVFNQRTTALKSMMVEQMNLRAAEQTFYERKCKAYLEPIGMYGLQQHHYMNFMQGVWRLTRTFNDRTLQMEAEALANNWLRRGLIAEHLIAIAQFFGIDLTAWP